jgi:hypothetical protein
VTIDRRQKTAHAKGKLYKRATGIYDYTDTLKRRWRFTKIKQGWLILAINHQNPSLVAESLGACITKIDQKAGHSGEER